MLKPPSPIDIIEDALNEIVILGKKVTNAEIAEIVAKQLDRWGMLIGSPWGE